MVTGLRKRYDHQRTGAGMSEQRDDWIDLLINCVISVVIVITVLAVKS
jgi:hypothetical protein